MDGQGDEDDQDDPAQYVKPLGGRAGLQMDVIVLHGRLKQHLTACFLAPQLRRSCAVPYR